jgi:hypothetical protein
METEPSSAAREFAPKILVKDHKAVGPHPSMLDLDKIEEPVDLFEGQDLEVILTDIIETNNTLVCLPKEAPEYIMGQSEDSLPCFDFSHYISSK